MLTNDNNRDGLLSAGGILSIVAGIFQIISGGVLIVDFLVSYQHGFGLTKWFLLPFFPDAWRHYILWGSGAIPASMNYVPIRWAIIGGCLGVLGIVAVVGGVSAIRRKSFGLSLAGAIYALPSVILGILAVIFVSLSKREFGAERKEMAPTSNHRRWLLSAGGVISIVAGALEVIEGSSVLTIQIYGRFFVILGVLAIVGGISALRRKSFGLSLAGAICALPLYSFLQPLGMLAIIFVALGKGEFGAERKEMASTGSGRDGLLSAGGILSIVAGITQIISAVSMAVFFLISSNLNHILWARWFFSATPSRSLGG
jgi:hypothetical protein